MYEVFLQIVSFVESLGYVGIFVMTFVESTFVPIPAEVTLIPAGYLAYSGEIDWRFALVVSTLGTLAGSAANYYIAYFFGRRLFASKGKYFFMNEAKLAKIERFFANHGAISVFTGRFLPGVKHFISFPAGLAKMEIKSFCLYTLASGAIWCGVLIGLGYIIGQNELLIKKYLQQLNYVVLGLVAILVAFYLWKKAPKKI